MEAYASPLISCSGPVPGAWHGRRGRCLATASSRTGPSSPASSCWARPGSQGRDGRHRAEAGRRLAHVFRQPGLRHQRHRHIESSNTAPSTTTNGIWTAKRGNDAFDDTNVYFHIDQSQRYIQSLGFTNIINRPMDVDTNGVSGDDNSHYSRGTSDYLAFGHGCVNDSEDADVIQGEPAGGQDADGDDDAEPGLGLRLVSV